MYVPSLVKIHWRMLLPECSQGCYAVQIWPGDIDLWPWKSIGFQPLLWTKYVPSLVKIHWRMLILECSQGCYAVKIWPGDIDLWPMTLKINRVNRYLAISIEAKIGQPTVIRNSSFNILYDLHFSVTYYNIVHNNTWYVNEVSIKESHT